MFYRPTWAEISKSAVTHNLQVLKKRAGSAARVMAVLKADAYGHGARTLAPVVLRGGASWIGVSSLEEGLDLRDSGIKTPILILGSLYPFKNFSIALKAGLTPTVASFESARYLNRLAEKRGRRASLHMKVDTGMGRIGVSLTEAKRLANWIAAQKNLHLQGVYSHLASADHDAEFTALQLRLFLNLKKYILETQKPKAPLFHIANSAALLRFKESVHDMARIGIALYGVPPFAHGPPRFSISPVLNWKSKIIFLKKVKRGTPISYGGTFVTKRDSLIATIPVGYADGLPRLTSNRGSVLVRGRRCPIVGRVTMDHTMIDVTGRPVDIGDPVTLIGAQGSQSIAAQDWAEWAETNAYEILCGISKRVPRVVVP